MAASMSSSRSSWMPLAVAVVSSGSRGNKLLFYHSGISKSQSLENELLSKLPQRTLAEILAPTTVMVNQKFELRVDEWKFVGHPFTLQQNSSVSASFNIVFVLQSTCSTEVVQSYDDLSHVLGVAVLHEEQRVEFIKNQMFMLIHIAEDADTIDQLSEKAVANSSLAKTLWHVLCGLQNGNPHVNVLVNDWTKISILIHSNETSPTQNSSVERTVRSYSSVILLSSIESITKQMSSCSPSFHRFLHTISPVKSLNQVSLDADISLQQAIKYTSHLVYWGQAMTVYPLSETNVYIASPTANTTKGSEVDVLFRDEFPDIDPLYCVLFHFSSPITLAEMRELYSDEKLIPITTWLLKNEQILQLHTYIYIVPPLEDDVMFTEDISNNELPIDIVSNLKQHLTEQEIEWVSTVSVSVDTEDIALFAKLSCHFHGNHHLEEILMLENMTRSQLLSLVDKFSEILTTISLPENK